MRGEGRKAGRRGIEKEERNNGEGGRGRERSGQSKHKRSEKQFERAQKVKYHNRTLEITQSMLPILQIRKLRSRETKGPAPERNSRSRENLRSLLFLTSGS